MSGFLNRWSKRKAGVEPEANPSSANEKVGTADLKKSADSSSKSINEIKDAEVGAKSSTENIDATAPLAKTPEAMPTIDDVMKLTKDSDFSAYVKPGIDPQVQQAAMQKLFSDPRYNIMDGLDIYIDDYSKPDPIPLDMLKKLNQSHMLGLFKTPEEKLVDQEDERIERAEYHERLKVIEDKEAADEKALSDANSETDESPSAINDENSAQLTDSAELDNSQEPVDVPEVNAAAKVDLKTQTKT
jgi:hypothetical protein